MENTKLFTMEHDKGIQKFGDTDFYLQFDKAAERHTVLDGAYDAYNAVFSIPQNTPEVIQELFDAYYKGFLYGENRGEFNGRMELQREMRLLLNL